MSRRYQFWLRQMAQMHPLIYISDLASAASEALASRPIVFLDTFAVRSRKLCNSPFLKVPILGTFTFPLCLISPLFQSCKLRM